MVVSSFFLEAPAAASPLRASSAPTTP